MTNSENGLETNFDQLLIQSDDEEIDTENEGDLVDTLVVAPEESESESDEGSGDESDASWSDTAMPHDDWTFTSKCGPDDDVFNCIEPIQYYELFLNREILDLIVLETNRYGKEKNEQFQETSTDEIKKFTGLCLQMGVVKMPHLRDCRHTTFGGISSNDL